LKVYHVYIMSSRSRAIYSGSTSALAKRVAQHRTRFYHGSHSAFYRIHRLVYYERHPTALSMVRREHELKGWTRAKKVALVKAMNPTWDDLAADWGLPDGPAPLGM
jgi:putative endonuclease